MVLTYIQTLKWPVVVFIILFVIYRHIPDLVKRVEEFGVGNAKIKLAPSQSINDSQVDELKADDESTEPAAGTDSTPPDLEAALTSDVARKAFDDFYNIIYGTQLSLLKLLQAYIPDGLTKEDLIPIYNDHKQTTANPYTTFTTYIQFLIDNALVTPMNSKTKKYQLSYIGLYFLNYLQTTGRYILPKPF